MKKILTLLGVMAIAGTTYGTIIFNDDFSDQDRSSTGASDIDWYGTTGSNAIEIDANGLGMISGTSGRGIHGTFGDLTLGTVGDSLVFTIDFTTPTTINAAADNNAFKYGVFNLSAVDDTFEFGDAPSSSDATWAGSIGYMGELDLNSDNDYRHREDTSTTAAATKLLGSTSPYTGFNSGPNGVYSIAAETAYTLTYTIARTGADEISITSSLDGGVTSLTDTTTADVTTFNAIAFHADTNAFGSTTTAGLNVDNGITFTNISLDATISAVPEPSTYAALAGLLALGFAASRRRRA